MKRSAITLLFALAFTGPGCAHDHVQDRTQKALDEKLAQEPPVRNREDLKREFEGLVKSTPGLSADQRTQLRSILDSTHAQAATLEQKVFKLRSVLMKDLLAQDFDQDKVDLIKSKIKDAERERLSLFFGAVRDINILLGRWASRTDRRNNAFSDQMMLETMDIYSL